MDDQDKITLKKDQISVLKVYEKWVEEDREKHLDFIKTLKKKVDELHGRCITNND